MSRGPGRIERAIHDLFDQHPEGAWTTEDLCRVIYPTANRTEKKHRVAVLRAMKKIAGKTDALCRDWICWQAETTGRSLVLFNHANVKSYSLARLKLDFCNCYASVRVRAYRRTEEQLLEQIQPGGRCHDHVIPGGAWDRHVREYIAKRDGDREIAEKLAAEAQRIAAEQDRALAAIFNKGPDNRSRQRTA